MGRRFTLYTDMEALTFLQGAKHLQGKLQMWAIELQVYDYEAVHLPGKLNQADPISRLADAMAVAQRPDGVAPRPGDLVAVTRHVTPSQLAPLPYDRRRTTCVVFTPTHVLVDFTVTGQIRLPCAYKYTRQERVQDVAIRALARCVVGAEATAAALLAGHHQCVGDQTTRHYLIMVDQREVEVLLDGSATFIPVTEPFEATGRFKAGDRIWENADDRRMVNRLFNWQRGSTATHPALAVAITAYTRRVAQRAPLVATLARSQGVFLDDGREAPKGLVDSPEAVHVAMQAIHAHVRRCRQQPELSPSQRTADDKQAVAIMAVDYEYTLARRKGIALAQCAIGSLIYVFDVAAVGALLFSPHDIEGEPSLRHWLESPEVVVVGQACTGDCRLLAEGYGVLPTCLFDTAVADSFIRQGTIGHSRGLGVLLAEYLARQMPLKGQLNFHQVNFLERPLDPTVFEYCWHDVAHCVELYKEQRRRLAAEGWLLAAVYEQSRSQVVRYGSVPAVINQINVISVCEGSVVVLRAPQEDRVRLRLTVGEGGGVCADVRMGMTLPTCTMEPRLVASLENVAERRAFYAQLRANVEALAYQDNDARKWARATVSAGVGILPRWTGTGWQMWNRAGCVNRLPPATHARECHFQLVPVADALAALNASDRRDLLFALGRMKVQPAPAVPAISATVATATMVAASAPTWTVEGHGDLQALATIQAAARGMRARWHTAMLRELVLNVTTVMEKRRQLAPLSGQAHRGLAGALHAGASAIRERAPAVEPADVDELCATIMPEDPWAKDVYMPGICCTVDHSEPTGLQRGVGLLPGTPPLAPDGQRIVMLCTGYTTRSKKIARFQCRYSLMLHQSGGESCTLMGHPQRNGWTLMNEPPKGVRANCSFYIIDFQLEFQPDAPESRAGGREGLRPVIRLPMARDSRSTWAVGVIVQTEPAGPDGKLYCHYGSAYDRDYEVGEPARAQPRVTSRDLEEFLVMTGSTLHANQILCLCAAPLDGNAERERRALYAGRHCARLQRADQVRGDVSLPVRVMQTLPVMQLPKPTPTGSAADSVMPVLPGGTRACSSVKDADWVVVVVYSGPHVVLMQRGAVAQAGKLQPEAKCCLAMERTTKNASGRFAAYTVVQMNLGPVWEAANRRWSEIDIVYHGIDEAKPTVAVYSIDAGKLGGGNLDQLCARSFALRSPTATTRAKFPGYSVELAGNLDGVDQRHQAYINRVLSERGVAHGEPVAQLKFAMDGWAMTGSFTQETMREDERVQIADPFMGEEPLSWSDLQVDEETSAIRVMDVAAPFYGSDIHRDVAQKFAATDPDAWTLERPFRTDMPDVGVGDGPGGGDSAEAVIHMGTTGRRLPHLDRPGDFLKRLLPAEELPSLDELIELQAKDPLCVAIRSRQHKEMAERSAEKAATVKVHTRMRVNEDRVIVALQPVASGGPRKSKARRADEARARMAAIKEGLARGRETNASVEEFEVLENGLVMHVTTGQDGRPQLEYVIPESAREALLAAAHDCSGHRSRTHTRNALRTGRVWWPGINRDVKQKCKACKTCAYNNIGPHVGAMHTPPKGREPWQVCSVDIVHLEETPSGFSKAVVFTCRLSKAVRATPCTAGIDSEEFLNIVTYTLVSEGIKPALMITDHDNVMISKLCDAYYEAFKITNRVADGDMHTAVGQNERFNTSLRAMARAAHFDTGCLWDCYLPFLVLFYNASTHPATGYSPFYLEHGREPSLPWSLARREPDADAPEVVRQHAAGLHLAWDFGYQMLAAQEAQRREEHNARYQTNVRYMPGERVLMLTKGAYRNKMLMPFIGPYRVLHGPDVRDRYCLRDLGRSNTNPWFHISRLKRWPDSAEDVEDLGDEHYIIQSVLDHRTVGSGGTAHYEFLVKWRGYSNKHNLWIGESEFNQGGKELMREYLTARGLPSRPASAAGANPPAAAGAGPPNGVTGQPAGRERRRREQPQQERGGSGAEQQSRGREERLEARDRARQVRQQQAGLN